MADELPGFSREPELEGLLDEDPHELDEDLRRRVQLYKSRKLQAKRDAGRSEDTPSWQVRFPGQKKAAPPDNGRTGVDSEPAPAREDAGASPVPPGRGEQAGTGDDGDEALMEYYRSVKSGPGRPRSSGRSEPGTQTASSPSAPSREEAEGDPADLMRMVREWVGSLEERLEAYHEKIVALEEANAKLREELARLQK